MCNWIWTHSWCWNTGGESGRGGKIGIVSGEAFNEIHFALKHPKKLRLERDEHYFNVLAVTLSDWVYTFGSLDALDNQWEAVQQEICMSAKRQARCDIFRVFWDM